MVEKKKTNSTQSGKILSSFITEINKSMNIKPDRLITLLTQQLENVDNKEGKKINRGKIRSRVGSKIESFNKGTTTFKSFLEYLKAIRVPAVSIEVTLHPNKPNIPIVFKRTLRFENVPLITDYEKGDYSKNPETKEEKKNK